MGAHCYGRDSAIIGLRRTLVAAPGIVTVTGRGGVGKTTLVEHATEDPSSWSAEIVERVVVTLAETSRADLVLPAIASALQFGSTADEPLRTRLQMALSAGTRLLVLDNFEHLLGAADDVGRLANDCPDLRIVVTSRVPLRVRGERIVEVPPFARAVEPFTSDQPALALFADAAGRANPEFTITGHESVIASICSRLDGVPLAIELAAARTSALSASQIDALLATGEHLAVLRRGPHDGPARQRDLEAAVAWSFELLGTQERELLADITVFSQWFTFDDVAAIAGLDIGDALDAVSALVDAHLVVTAESTGRRTYRLPVPVREFAARRLARDAAATSRVRAAHRAHLMNLAAAALLQTESASGQLGITRLADAESDLLHSLDVALAEDDAPLAAAVAPALCALWFRRGMYPEMRAMVADAVALVERAGLPAADRAHVGGWLALLDAETRFDAGDPARIEKALLEAADLARSAGNVDVRLRTLWFVTLAARTVHNFDSAIAAAEEGMAVAEAAHRDLWLGRLGAECGMVAQKVGDYERAMTLGLQALQRGRSGDDASTVVRAIAVLRPPVRGWSFDAPSSCPSLAEALRLAIATEDAHAWRYLYPMAAGEAMIAGRPAVAAGYLADGLRDAVTSGNVDYGRIDAFMLSAVAAANGEWELAAELHGMIVEHWPRIGRGVAGISRDVSERRLARLRDHIDPDALDEALARGAARPVRDAIPWALTHAERFAVLGSDGGDGDETTAQLTERELAVLRLLARGLANKEIAAALGITAKTAMHHTSHIYRKLGVRGRAEASAVAHRSGLMTEPR